MIEYQFNKAQSEYLASTADVVLYGGQAGAGKSLVAIIDMLGLNESPTPRYMLSHYRAMICRKRRGDLVDLIDKSKSIYPLVDPGAVFNNSDCYWTFSSGCKIYFKYFERMSDAEKFLSGQELQMIVFEEVQQHENPDIFTFAMSRLRSAFGLKCYMRATCNPGKFPWLKNWFRIDDAGNSTDFKKEMKLEDGTVITKHIKFIRARLQDNKHIGKDYEANLMLLSEEDRLALACGRWDSYASIKGMVFVHEIKKLNAENRYCHIAHDPSQPVYTFWDIGSSDMTVILFVQFIGKEVRIIDMIKDNNKALNDYYMPEVMKRKDDLGYRYGGHYMPHDSGKREWTNNTKIIDQARKVTNDVFQLPKDRIADGLQSAKTMFANVFINKSKCSDLYDDLTHYRREYDEDLGIYSEKPLHDKHSHSGDVFRYVSYYKPVTLQANDITPGRSASPFTYSR